MITLFFYIFLYTGNLVVIDDVSRTTIWESFKNLGNTMLPQSTLMYDLFHGKKRALTSWKSYSDPSLGNFSLEITSQSIQRSPGSCNRTGSFSYSTLRNFNLSYLTLTPEGNMEIYWDQGQKWMHHLTEPEHSCDIYDTFGSSRTTIIAGATASLSIFVILVFSAYTFWRYRTKQNVPNFMFNNTSQDARKNDLEPQDVSGIDFFEMHTIRTATNNFSSSNKLGQGGFGPVYKGKLVGGQEIAVKRLSSSSGQETEEFMNEITLISKLQHRNLVRLLGCCIKGEEKLLIYGFLENKSLDVFLFDSSLKFEIDWAKRFDIVQGIARGILYLHRDSRLRVIHRDLKVSNILLDDRMIPKISDFGLARMFQGTQFQDNTRRVVGTLGYMSPEYAWTGVFSEKSVIYAFGVLLLEIISGKRSQGSTMEKKEITSLHMHGNVGVKPKELIFWTKILLVLVAHYKFRDVSRLV
ncbi:BnaCnng09920D [Brassica napus]|uniref:BnaCnng09920D protein n=1 Tax=Brassica napus TaxID=3708 RepID=A0A078HUA7_BRANA|nr:BnaCnng09920D [Brassica napus]